MGIACYFAHLTDTVLNARLADQLPHLFAGDKAYTLLNTQTFSKSGLSRTTLLIWLCLFSRAIKKTFQTSWKKTSHLLCFHPVRI